MSTLVFFFFWSLVACIPGFLIFCTYKALAWLALRVTKLLT